MQRGYIILIPNILSVKKLRDWRSAVAAKASTASSSLPKARRPPPQGFVKNAKVDEFGHPLWANRFYIAGEIEEHTGWETRYVILSHLQRGGSPSARDRLMARRFGIAAVDMIVSEDFGRMVSLRQGEITSVPLKSVTERLNLIDLSKHYDTERYNAKRSFL
jgi:6-phosphofructokinase 1